MKRFTIINLMSLAITLTAFGQNQNVIIDDVYFNSKNSGIIENKKTDKNQTDQSFISKSRPNYKNGAKEIIYKERNISNPEIIRDTVYVVGHAGDTKPNYKPSEFNLSDYDGKTNPIILHDTIYVSEGMADNLIDSLYPNREHGYYVNGFKGDESDLEYAERIRRFHNPKYTIFIGDPRYNDALFLNNYDWNVYVDGSYAYVTPTWTNPYWWNYEYGFWGYNGGFGGHSPFYSGFGGFYDPWGYNGFYGYGGMYGYAGMYGYGNYWDPYGYGYGYGGYYGNYYGYGYGGNSFKNKNYDEGTRRSAINNGNRDPRIGGTRNSTSASTTIAGGSYTGQSRNQYTVVSNSSSNTTNSSVVTRGSLTSSTRTLSGQPGGIGVVRRTFNRGTGTNLNISSSNRSTSTYINTQPRTYSTTVNNIPTSGSSSRGNYSTITNSNRSSSTTIFRNSTNNSASSVSPSRESYSGETRSNSSTYSPAPSYSTGSSGSSGNSGGGSRSSGSSGGRR